ncbi:14737_t:CDS:2 [Funneliformis caledonium]|uniref:14737_t:CDS:1 n=1 Tax=Funneliformis caledonium TaxID=1117310 RepID=A0A9N9BB21_9GLOM|nr:14737_t:CDS:2 [Funneliformis caledonium]
MSIHKNIEWTIIKTYEEDDFVCVDFHGKKNSSLVDSLTNNCDSNKDYINDFESSRVKSKPCSDKKRNQISSLKCTFEDEYYPEWNKYISKFRNAIYYDEVEKQQNQIKELKIIQGKVERDLEHYKRNPKIFKEAHDKYIENQKQIKKLDEIINKLLQEVYKLNQLRDEGKYLLDNKICFGLSNVDYETLRKFPAECFPAFLVEFNHRRDSKSIPKGDLRYLDSLPQGIKDNIIKSTNKYNIKFTIDMFNEDEKRSL